MSRRKNNSHRKSRKTKTRLTALFLVVGILLVVLVVLLVLVKRQEKERALTRQTLSSEAEGEGSEEKEAFLPEEPLETETETEERTAETETEAEEPVTLLFTGDILLEGTTLARYQSEGLSGILSEPLAGELRDADVLMINEEFPFGTTGEAALDKQYTFRTDPSFVSAFQDMGADLVGLANNHVLDFGQSALLETFATLDGANLRYAGAGENLSRAKELQVFEVKGKRLGFLAASRVWPDTSWAAGEGHPGVFGTYDPTLLLSAITSAKEEAACDFVTVFVHWGIERNPLPEDYQRGLAAQYAAAGADLVIGMHPHVLQGIEYAGDTPVFYSLGNFIFGGRTYDTAAVKATIAPDGTVHITVLPCIASGGCTRLAEGSDAERIYSTLTTLSFGAAVDENGNLTR